MVVDFSFFKGMDGYIDEWVNGWIDSAQNLQRFLKLKDPLGF